MIPKIIHNIWIQGYDQLPEEIQKNHLHVKKLNPDWEFMIWDNHTILKLLQKYPAILSLYKNISQTLVFNSQTMEKQKKEILRIKGCIAQYVILKEYGGVYYDVHIECPFHLNELFQEKEENCMYILKKNLQWYDYFYYLFPFSDPYNINTSLMAFSKDHPVLNITLQKLVKLRTAHQIENVLKEVITYEKKDLPISYLKKEKDCFVVVTNDTINYYDYFIQSLHPYLKEIHHYYKQIYLVLFLLFLMIGIHRLSQWNSRIFSMPSPIPIPGVPTSNLPPPSSSSISIPLKKKLKAKK